MDPQLIHPDAPEDQTPGSPEQDPFVQEHAHAGGVDPSDVSAITSHAESRGKPKPKKSERDMGKTLLPVARVQKILKADKEMSTCGKDAVFLISVAAEEFIKRLAQAGHQQALRDKRSTVQQRDLATAVRTTQHEELSFLEDIIPPAMTLSRALELASQFDPNDLFAEPPNTSQSRRSEGKRKEKGNEAAQDKRDVEEPEDGLPHAHDGLNGKEKGKERERDKGKEKTKERKSRNNAHVHINGVASEHPRTSSVPTGSPGHPIPNGAGIHRESPPRSTARAYTHHHHVPFNPPQQHHHEPRLHAHSHDHPPLQTNHHHHHHVHLHSPVQAQEFPPPHLSPVTNGAIYSYPPPGPTHQHPPPPERPHPSETRHSPRELRYSPHSPRDHYFPPPPDLTYHHHPLPPLPAHYHDLPPPGRYEPHHSFQQYGPYWQASNRDGYDRREYVDARDLREDREGMYEDVRDSRYGPAPTRAYHDRDPRES